MRILIVEDDVLLAIDLRQMLTTLEHEVIASATTLEEGLTCVEKESFDLSIVDLNLSGKSSVPLGKRLREKELPVIVATGYDPSVVPPELADLPRLGKPYNVKELKSALETIGALETSS